MGKKKAGSHPLVPSLKMTPHPKRFTGRHHKAKEGGIGAGGVATASQYFTPPVGSSCQERKKLYSKINAKRRKMGLPKFSVDKDTANQCVGRKQGFNIRYLRGEQGKERTGTNLVKWPRARDRSTIKRTSQQRPLALPSKGGGKKRKRDASAYEQGKVPLPAPKKPLPALPNLMPPSEPAPSLLPSKAPKWRKRKRSEK